MATSPSGTMETKMNLTKQKLLELIQEQLMLEVLDSEPYPFKIYDGPNYADDNSKMFVEYTFVSQKDEKARKFRYIVKFYIKEEKLEVEVDFKANDLWRMTNQLDWRVLATIGAIVKDFAKNVRPTLRPPFNEVTKFKAITYGEFKGDARRMRIYKWMLQKNIKDKETKATDLYVQNIGSDGFDLSWEIPL